MEEECRRKRQALQRNSVNNDQVSQVPSIVHSALNSPGQPLDSATRAFMEPRFGHDFSHVRVHTDSQSSESARRINALAYTVGRDIVFGRNQYSLGSAAGKRLLAHELAHVVQQHKGGGAIQRQTEYEASPDDLEKQRPSGPATIESSTEDEEPMEEQDFGIDESSEDVPLMGKIRSPNEPAQATLTQKSSQIYQKFEKEADIAADSIMAGQCVNVHKGVVTSPSPYLQAYIPRICDRPSTQFSDFPKTYISRIDVDLTSPKHDVTLTWTGPNAAKAATGPFHSSPGAGCCHLNCDDATTSRKDGSRCTPKGGPFKIHSYACAMSAYPEATNVSYFSRSGIAFHYYPEVPNYPASHGCVRLGSKAAQLILDNSLKDITEVTVDGTWKRGKKCWECSKPKKQSKKRKGKK